MPGDAALGDVGGAAVSAALRVAVLLAAFFAFGGGALVALVLHALGAIGP